jgi:hypothetical protein
MSSPEEDMANVNVHPNGPTDPDEMEKLASRYPYDEKSGTFSLTVGDDQ